MFDEMLDDEYVTMEMNGNQHLVHPWDVLIRDRVIVEWVELGEGWSGEYNEEDPNDIELLRFDVSWLGDNGEWVDPGDASYCTRMPVKAPPGIRQEGLEYLMNAVYQPLMDGHSIKKICEELSWISPDMLLKDICPKCGDQSCYYDGGDIFSKGRICNTCNHSWTVK